MSNFVFEESPRNENYGDFFPINNLKQVYMTAQKNISLYEKECELIYYYYNSLINKTNN